MANAPKNPYSDLSKPAKKWIVWLGGEGGLEPTRDEETKRLVMPMVTRTPGGPLDHCEFQYNLGGENERIVDSYLKEGFARQVMVMQEAAEKDQAPVLVFWGDIVGERKSVTNSEQLVVVASIMPYHFGDILQGPVYRQEPAGDLVTHQDDVMFNPVYDEIVEPNKAVTEEIIEDSDDTYSVWLHPDSSRTQTALIYAQDGEDVELWYLDDVINTLCWHLNPDQTFIKNPTKSDLLSWLADAPNVRNLRIPSGKHLNDYLDMILLEYGFGWRMDYKFEEIPELDENGDPVNDDDGNPIIEDVKTVSFVIYKLNEGQEVDFYQQRPGTTTGASFLKSNTTDFDIETEIASTANEIVVHGGYKEYEITVELYRGWPEADDGKTADQLTMSTGEDYEDNQSAWRLWVANEGGDYCGNRITVAPIPTTPLDLSSILGANTIPKRRKAYDALTHYEDDPNNGARRRRPPFIQWYNADNEWKPLPSGWGETVLEDQIGIYFAGDEPPSELIDRGNNARIRMTFTVFSDEKITATAQRQSTSPNGRINQLFLDVGDRFTFREVVSAGPFASVLAGVPTADEKDDQTALEDFAEAIRSTEDCAIIRGTVTLIGIHLQYKIGQVVKSVKGRDVSLNRMAKTSKSQKYLQIVEVTYNQQEQETYVTLQPVQDRVDRKFMQWVA